MPRKARLRSAKGASLNGADVEARAPKQKLGRLVNVNYHETPRRSSYGNGPSMLTVRALASFQREDDQE